jgi:hypothetical protein
MKMQCSTAFLGMKREELLYNPLNSTVRLVFELNTTLEIYICKDKMTYDPISNIQEQELQIDNSMISSLKFFLAKPKLVGLPGVNVEAEKARLTEVSNALAKRILAGIEVNPIKVWVMKQFQVALVEVEMEGTEAREYFAVELYYLMDILQVESSDGLLNHYLG